MRVPSYRCGDFSIDPNNRRFSRGDAEVALEPKVFAVIVHLLERAGDLVSRNELLDTVWGHRYVTASTLNRVVALARRAFGDDADDPRFIQTVHGAGYRFVGSVERPGELAVVLEPPAPMRLPARVEALIGREHELARLSEMLTQHRAVTLLGTGGMGKTQCALELARRVAPGYHDGVWFLDLAPLASASEWLRALAGALSIRRARQSDALEEIGHLLTGQRMLLVLDNCDRIAAETGELVHALLRGTDALRVLSTSQQALGFVGEQQLRIPPLALPDERATDLASVQAAPACALLLQRTSAVQPGFALTEDNRATIVEICRRLDGMPLALELAAARFAVLSPDQVLARLTQRFRFLASDLAGREKRHRNLLTLLDWSYSLLSGAEQRLLAWLGVFVGGWTVDTATMIASSLGHDASTTVELLTGLVNKSLVTIDPSYASPRYRLLESVREFALERLRRSGEEELARDAHLSCVGRLCSSSHRQILIVVRKVPYPHPGEILLEEFLKPMGITQYRLAKEIGVPQRRIGEIVAGTRGVTADTGLRLSRFFGMSECFWTGLQMDYDAARTKDALSKILSRIRPWRADADRLRSTDRARATSSSRR